MLDLGIEQVDEQGKQGDVEKDKYGDGGDDLFGRQRRADTFGRFHQTVDDPGLAADFGHPPTGHGNRFGQENTQYKDPQQPAHLKYASLPVIEDDTEQADGYEE